MSIKKLTATIIAITMLISLAIPVAAQQEYTYMKEAKILYDAGLYNGISATDFEPDLGSGLTREQGITMLIRIMGLEKDALLLEEAEIAKVLEPVPDAQQISDWARAYVAYGIKNNLIAGLPDGSFNPKDALLGKAYCTLILRAMGYTVDATRYQIAAAELSKIGGLSIEQTLLFNDKSLIKDDLIGISYSSLQAKFPDGKTIMSKLVENSIVDEDFAIDMDIYPEGKKAREEAERLAKEKEEQALKEKAIFEEAELAVIASEQAKIDTIELINNAEELIKLAEEKIKLVTNNADRSMLETRIALKNSAIETKRDELKNSEEMALKQVAELAVAAYENATILTLEQITTAESLEKLAREKVGLVLNDLDRIMLEARITAKKAETESTKAKLQEVANAKKLLDDYLSAPYATSSDVAAAEILGVYAQEAIGRLNDEAIKTSLLEQLSVHKAKIIAKKEETKVITVKDVTSDTLKVIKITFTKAVNSDTVSTSTVTASHAIGSRVLSEDGMTLTIDLLNAVNQSDTVKITLDGIKDINGMQLAKYEKSVLMVDTTLPSVLGVEYINRSRIRFLFNEPVSYTTNGIYKTTSKETLNGIVELKLDDMYAFAKFTPEDNYLIVDFMNLLDTGAHEVILTGVSDYAGYRIQPVRLTFNVFIDSVPPVAVSVEAPNTSMVIIKFDEEITINGDPSVKVKEIGGTEYVINKSNMIADKTQLKINLISPLSAASLIGFTATVSDVEDTSGNKCEETSLSGTIKDDITAPEVVSYKVLTNNNVQLVFNKDVDVSYASAIIIDSRGNRTPRTITLGSDENVEHDYVVNTGLQSANIANYFVEIEGIVDKSIRRNAIAKMTLPFITNDTIPPRIEFVVHKPDNKIEITFSEPMSAETVNNIQAYFLKNRSELISLLGTDARVFGMSSDYTRVTLQVPKNMVYDAILILGAKDSNGIVLEGPGASLSSAMPISSTYDMVTGSDLVYEIIEPRKVKMSFGKDINGNDLKPGYSFISADVSAFKFYLTNGDSYNPGVIGALITDNGRAIELITSISFNTDGTVNITKDQKSGVYLSLSKGVMDMNSNDVIISEKKTINDKIKATQLSARLDDYSSSKIILAFSENIKCVFPSGTTNPESILAAGIKITNINSQQLIPVAEYTVEIIGSSIVITMPSAKKGDFYVEIVRPDYITDFAGNIVEVLDSVLVRNVNN